MRYLELFGERPLLWGLFFVYLALTSYLAWLGHKKTTDIRSFAVGKGDMHPAVVGVTLAASIASTATFVINPGFVYVHGVSALMHFGVAAGLGIVAGLVLLSTGFRRVGAEVKAITLPQWMGQRYGSKGLAVAFAAINLLSLFFVVLIIGGVSIVMQVALGLTNVESLVIICGFVFSYVFVGGTYAHAYTNTLQGLVMVVVALFIVGSGLHLFGDGVGAFLSRVASAGPELSQAINVKSPLFGSFFSVFVCGFVIGFALVCQPHIMTKALYVKTDRAVRQYLTVAIAVSFVFTALLLVGLYARVMELPAEALVNPATGEFSQDRVMAAYLAESFGPVMMAVVTVALLAAGMSTLDGILVALSTIAANDLFLNLAERRLAHKTEDERAKIAHRASQGILVGMGVLAFVIALDPPALLGIFGMVGVYGIVAASTVPIVAGIASKRVGKRTAAFAAGAGLGVHFALYGAGAFGSGGIARWALDAGFANPGVTATWGLLASAAVALAGALLAKNGHAERPALAELPSTP